MIQKKIKQTSKSTESILKKQSQSLATHSSQSQKTIHSPKKKDSLRLVVPKKKGVYLSSIAIEPKKTKKKLSGSSQPEGLPNSKKNVWKNYDFENLPELNKSQLKSFKKVSGTEHNKFKKAVVKHFGRPKKDPALKENIVSIRLSNFFLDKIKKRAISEGYPGWQSFAKKVLTDYLDSKK